MEKLDAVLSKVTGFEEAEVRKIMDEVTKDCKEYPTEVRAQQLRAAGWTSDPSGAIWLPPKGIVPNRPYQRYSAWKRMRELAAA